MSPTAPPRRRALLAAAVVVGIALLGSLAAWAATWDSSPVAAPSGTAGADATPDPDAASPGPDVFATPTADPDATVPAGPGEPAEPAEPGDPAAPAPSPTADPPGEGTSSPPSDGRRPTDVMVTFAGWDAAAGAVIAGAYVPDLVETGGTCTLTLTRGASMVSAATQALPDAASTVCGDLAVSGPSVTAGSWTAQVTYESATVVGLSATQIVEVP